MNFKKKCKCGHNHIGETGGKDGYTLTKERIIECLEENCDCERYEEER